MGLHLRMGWGGEGRGGEGGILDSELYGIFFSDYRTPNLNPSTRAYNYFCYGAACSEVEIDCLTGDHLVRYL